MTSRMVSKKEHPNSKSSYRDMNYREKPATPNSPSGTTVTTMYDHLLSPPSPNQEEEKDDRLRNDLLDEICNDMGIDDSMDLDFDDFCYNGQQKNGVSGSVYNPLTTPHKPDSNSADGRRHVTSSGGYATSDSLCAIAKLTQSINNSESQSTLSSISDQVESKRSSPDTAGTAVSLKQEPCDITDSSSSTNDTDQGKAAAAASKLALQRQSNARSPLQSVSTLPPAPARSLQADLKRKRDDSQNHEASAEQSSAVSEHPAAPSTAPSLTHQQSWPPQNYQQPPQSASSAVIATQRSQSCVDYSYPDDYCMEDMTSPDTMINFSARPQQPNYYQLPQSAAAHDNVNLNFNMSLQSHSTSQQANSSPAATTPFSSLHHLSNAPSAHQNHNPFGQTRPAFTSGSSGDVPMGRSSPQPKPTLMASASTSHMQQLTAQQGSTGSFHPCSSAPGSLQPSHHPTPPPTPSHKPPPTTAVSQAGQAVGQSVGLQSGTSSPSPSISSSAASINGSSGQQGFMQRLVTDKSSAFRSHPLFPLLRDLIIADMNFHEPTFPHQLIADLPSDFNKLLKNYLTRNPVRGYNYQYNHSVESVVMDALKYAHQTLIDKLQRKKASDLHHHQQLTNGQSSRSTSGSSAATRAGQSHTQQRKPSSSVNSPVINMATAAGEYCDKYEDGEMYSSDAASSDGAFNQPLSVDTSCPSQAPSRPTNHPSNHSTASADLYAPPPQYPVHGLPQAQFRASYPHNQRPPYMNPPHAPGCPPPNYTVSPHNPPLSRHQQTLFEMGPPATPGMYSGGGDPYITDPYCMPPPGHHQLRMPHMGDRPLMYMNSMSDGNMVKTMLDNKDLYADSMSDTASVMSAHSMQGSIKGNGAGQGKQGEGRKHASLPKEAVNIMLTWLRDHQDKPYPNDDEKGLLIKQTGLSITQINYWFTNARRRLLPKWRGEDM